MGKPLISVVAPVYNEEALIAEFIHELEAVADNMAGVYDFEFVLCDDGSNDRSLEIMKGLVKQDPRLRVVELRRHYGQTPALQAGLDHARGDIIITMDSDLQCLPGEIPVLVAKLLEGYDIVNGWRRRRAEGILRRWPSRLANLLLRAASGVPLHDFGCPFRAISREMAGELRLLGEAHRYVSVLGWNLGARMAEIEVTHVRRRGGKSHYGLSRAFGVLVDIIMIRWMRRYHDRPIRLFGKLGLVLFGAGLILIGGLAIYGLAAGVNFLEKYQGWLILGVVLVVLAAQSLMTGFVAEVLIRARFTADNSRVYRVRRVWTDEQGNKENGRE